MEKIQFNSLTDERLRVSVSSGQAGQFTGLNGGDGWDQFMVVVLSDISTSFTLQPLTLTNWNADDNVMLFALSQGVTPSDFVLNSAAYGGQAVLVGGAGNDTLTSGAGNDFLPGREGNDTLAAGAGNDQLDGGAGDDILRGNGGDDILIGGSGADQLTGGIGADRFVFGDPAHSTVALPDLITDFDRNAGDRINLSGIDAIAGGGDDPFTFLAGGAFDSTPGRVISVVHAPGHIAWRVTSMATTSQTLPLS